jgi:hypothetical protein
MERKDAIVRNRQQTLQVHNVVTITMVDGLLTGGKELVHSISIILGLGEIFLHISIFSLMVSHIYHVVLV